VDGKLVHHIVSAAQARLIQRAIANYRAIGELLARWERETVADILYQEPPDDP
jgi:hypothetical protein